MSSISDYTVDTEFKNAVVKYAKCLTASEEALLPVKALVLKYWSTRDLYFQEVVGFIYTATIMFFSH